MAIDCALLIEQDLLELWGERENIDDLDDEELLAYSLALDTLMFATLPCGMNWPPFRPDSQA